MRRPRIGEAASPSSLGGTSTMMAVAEKLQGSCASLPYCVQQTMSAIRDVIYGFRVLPV